MRRFSLPILLSLAALGPLALAPGAAASGSVGTPEQVSWVRSATTRFLTAELQHNGSAVCSILNAPMRRSYHNRSCEQRWDARLASLLSRKGARDELRADSSAVDSSRVVVHGTQATIALPHPLLDGVSRLLWTENCWMVES